MTCSSFESLGLRALTHRKTAETANNFRITTDYNANRAQRLTGSPAEIDRPRSPTVHRFARRTRQSCLRCNRIPGDAAAPPRILPGTPTASDRAAAAAVRITL